MEHSGMNDGLEAHPVEEDDALMPASKEQLIKELMRAGKSQDLPAAVHRLATYVGAAGFLLARCDLIQEQGLDFIVSSDWPFDLVRRMGSELASIYSRSTELEKCLLLLSPTFAPLPDDVILSDELSRQYCSIGFCVGKTRYSLLLLFNGGVMLPEARLREVGLLAAYVASVQEYSETRIERDFDLTDRELECLFWIAEGKTSDEIATILGISRNTINNYITSVMRKTGTKTRSEAIAYAVRNNLV